MQVPDVFDAEKVRDVLKSRTDPDPLKTVLVQEIDRYNELLAKLARSLLDVDLGVRGLVVVTPELEAVVASLLDYAVPKSWSTCYPSLKPLGAWTRDLARRVSELAKWVDDCLPRCFWLPMFTYPTGFLTALLQTAARKQGIAIDTLAWDFPIVTAAPSAISQHARDGAYIHGLWLEGAKWDDHEACLVEPAPMDLVGPMPVIHFKPVDAKNKTSPKSSYECPLYMYPTRTGTRERPSFVILVDLTTAPETTADFWILRGTALLLSTAF